MKQQVSLRPEEGHYPFQPVVVRVHTFFKDDVWAPDVARRSPPVKVLYRVARVLYLSVHGFFEDRCLFRSSALTYITVLSLVPMLAFAFSVAKGVGAYDKLRTEVIDDFIDRNLPIEENDSAEAIMHLREAIDTVLQFVSETNVQQLGTVTLLILVSAVIKMLGTVERSLNDIWGVHKSRSWVRKLSDYISMSVITPVFLVSAVAITTAAHDNRLVTYLQEQTFIGTFVEAAFKIAPVLAVGLAFSLVYLIVPNTRTRLVSSLIGGFVGATLWQLAQIGHVKFQIGMANYNALYAGFAAFPIFLFWIYVSWVTVMVGAEVTYAHQSEPAYRELARSKPSVHAVKEVIALRAAVRIADRFVNGGKPWSAPDLAEELGLPQDALREVLTALVDGGLFFESGEREVYLPARDIESITVKDILDAEKGGSTPTGIAPEVEADRHVTEILAQLDAEVAHSSANKTLRELARDLRRTGPEPAPVIGAPRAAEQPSA